MQKADHPDQAYERLSSLSSLARIVPTCLISYNILFLFDFQSMHRALEMPWEAFVAGLEGKNLPP
jgi:hypothetical protein